MELPFCRSFANALKLLVSDSADAEDRKLAQLAMMASCSDGEVARGTGVRGCTSDANFSIPKAFARNRREFTLYADELQNFATESFRRELMRALGRVVHLRDTILEARVFVVCHRVGK